MSDLVPMATLAKAGEALYCCFIYKNVLHHFVNNVTMVTLKRENIDYTLIEIKKKHDLYDMKFMLKNYTRVN